MSRPFKRRRICALPETAEFGPRYKKNAALIEMTVDEYEAIRLIDQLGFTQEDCAAQMNVARTTVQSIYDSARKKLAEVLVDGKRLEIRGGSYDVCLHGESCCGKDCRGRSCQEGHCAGGGCPCRTKKTEIIDL